jgi:putative ABC transport system substrate-binding protein
MNIRRKFIFTLFAGALLPRWASAQQDRVLRIAWLSNAVAENSPFLDAFRAGMRELGYVEGRNLIIDARWGAGSIERTEQLAVELAASKPDVIVVAGGQATHALIRAGAVMPVVFGYSGHSMRPIVGAILDRQRGKMQSWRPPKETHERPSQHSLRPRSDDRI